MRSWMGTVHFDSSLLRRPVPAQHRRKLVPQYVRGNVHDETTALLTALIVLRTHRRCAPSPRRLHRWHVQPLQLDQVHEYVYDEQPGRPHHVADQGFVCILFFRNVPDCPAGQFSGNQASACTCKLKALPFSHAPLLNTLTTSCNGDAFSLRCRHVERYWRIGLHVYVTNSAELLCALVPPVSS